jgi:hypothetical protein
VLGWETQAGSFLDMGRPVCAGDAHPVRTGVPDTLTLCPQNCMFDTCNCEKSEDCMCAALSSYVRACAAKGVLLRGWRDGVCSECALGKPSLFLIRTGRVGESPLVS